MQSAKARSIKDTEFGERQQIEGDGVLNGRAVALVLSDSAVELTVQQLSSIHRGKNTVRNNNGADLLVRLGNLA